jgi:hypothetical protein
MHAVRRSCVRKQKGGLSISAPLHPSLLLVRVWGEGVVVVVQRHLERHVTVALASRGPEGALCRVVRVARCR